MTYGAAIVSLKTPDRTGQFQNIVLGFNTLQPYLAGVPYFGATALAEVLTDPQSGRSAGLQRSEINAGTRALAQFE
jgi:hypothetical protein